MENKELLEKARQANSPDELLALAKENGIELSETSAEEYFEKLHRSGEMSEEELENVSGGGCSFRECICGYPMEKVDGHFRCRKCGRGF